MSKKVLALILCAFLTLALFAGCNNEPAPQSGGNSSTGDAGNSDGGDSGSGDAGNGGSDAASYSVSNNVEFICPYSAGGGSDLYARLAAEIIQKNSWCNQTIMVDNRTGGAGAVGDAYTFSKRGQDNVITTYVSAQITAPLMNNTEVTYKDLTPIANLAMDEYTVGVLSSSPYQTIDEFIEAARANPGSITIGGSGKGTEDELVTGLMAKYYDVQFEYVSFNSSAEVMTSMLGEHIVAGIYNPNECDTQYEAGEVTILAAFGPQRINMFPDVPTFTELGQPDIIFQQFRGIFGPPDMPQEAVDYWVETFRKVTESEQWKTEYLEPNGLTHHFLSGDEFNTFLDGEAALYEEILKDIGAIG